MSDERASATPVRPTLSRAQAPARTRRLLGVLGFLAAMGVIAVNIVDPYSGATASPYFQLAPRYTAEDVQSLVVAGTYESAFDRDAYGAEAPPPPPPPPPPADASDDDDLVPPSITPDPGSAQAIAQGMVAARGWSDEQFSCLVSLWNKESGWRVNAMNPSSGAYGIPQSYPGEKMAAAGADWRTNPATQITWGLDYISGRYGSPCGAWSHSEAVGSY